MRTIITTTNTIIYKVFGLGVFSEIPLPELSQGSLQEDQADIRIEKADLSKLWTELADSQPFFVAQENFFMFQVPNTAIFCIENGERIVVSPIKGADEDVIRLYILGTCMGALLLQRKALPLHGSAVAIDGKAYAFIGDRGAGKSTLASAFLNRGYKLLSDDVIAISFSSDQIPWVKPAYPQQKLWQESLNEFGMESSRFRPIFQRETKYAVPVLSQFSDEPLPLSGVFELMKTEIETIEIRPIEGIERLQPLLSHTYRNYLLSSLGLLEWHFNTSIHIANQIRMFRLHRPTSGFTVHHLVSLVLTTLNQEE